ncbi:MAG: uroporphyrinogen-III synthase [Acidobacteriota bacterium]|nr:uroporphyrinogen-III synthase [Acidobacteriota bacterium]
MSGRILLLRSSAAGSEDATPGDVTVLHTHAVAPRPEGIAEALAFDARDATLVVSSKETIRFLLPLFRAPFERIIAVGEGTGELLRRVAAGPPVVPEVPGAAGVLQLLRKSSAAAGMRILWPHGSDASSEPFEEIRKLGISLAAPVVYEKKALSSSELNPSILADFRAGRFAAVAVGSTAGLDALLAALDVPAASLPPLRWGVLGPETAKAVTNRGLPQPLVSAHARLTELFDLLRKEIR